MKYRGIIVEEGLNNNRIVNNVTVLKMHITGHEQKNERWHLFEVEIEEEFIENVAKEIIGNWYAHFWHGTDVIAVFSNKLIKFNYLDKNTWKEVMEYGRKYTLLCQTPFFHGVSGCRRGICGSFGLTDFFYPFNVFHSSSC